MAIRNPLVNQAFALAGDRTLPPVTAQPDGSVSFNQGWGADYQADPDTDPDAKPVERQITNALLWMLTSNLQQYQREGVPEFIAAADNGGVTVAYPLGVCVMWRAVDTDPWRVYINTVSNNTAVPSPTSTTWLDLTAVLGSYKTSVALTAATSLTIADSGKAFSLNSGGSIVLPLLSTVPRGTKFVFGSTAAGRTVAVQGSDTINPLSGSGSITSFTLNIGDTLELVSNGTQWVAFGGSAQLQYSTKFGAALSGNGWQRLPSGLLVQWGGVSGFSSYTVSFPIAFPVTPVCLLAGNNGTAGNISATCAYNNNTTFGLYQSSVGSAYWIAVGY